MAEWVYINKSIDTFYYINPETIQKSGNTIKIWTLGDFIEVRKLKNGVINLIYNCYFDAMQLLCQSRFSSRWYG